MQPTDPKKFTEKAWQAITRTPDLAKQAQQQQIESEHLMRSHKITNGQSQKY